MAEGMDTKLRLPVCFSNSTLDHERLEDPVIDVGMTFDVSFPIWKDEIKRAIRAA